MLRFRLVWSIITCVNFKITGVENEIKEVKQQIKDVEQEINTLHVEIIYTSPFINAEIKVISLRSK